MRSKVTVVLLFLNVVLFFYIFKFEAHWRAEARSFARAAGEIARLGVSR